MAVDPNIPVSNTGFPPYDYGVHEAAGGIKDGTVLVTVCWLKQKAPRPVQLMTD